MELSWGRAMWRNFLGQSPDWYKLALLVFLVVNPIIFFINPFIAGWLLVAEFIFTLAMALKCYPLLPGGLLAIEAVIIGMTSATHSRVCCSLFAPRRCCHCLFVLQPLSSLRSSMR